MAKNSLSTKQVILTVINDIEIITKELFEVLTTVKGQARPNAVESNLLMDLLIEKDNDLKENLKTAAKQAEVEKTIDAVKAEIRRVDEDIVTLQSNLKEAETVLSTAVYQAHQKLSAVQVAGENTVESEELIKYSHKISASNAVAAPPMWVPGDPRRPYPTEFEMRLGYLGKLSDLSGSSQSHLSYLDILGPSHTYQIDPSSVTSASSMPWQQTEIVPAVNRQPSVDGRSQAKDGEEVAYMSSDSSSSSSSDD